MHPIVWFNSSRQLHICYKLIQTQTFKVKSNWSAQSTVWVWVCFSLCLRDNRISRATKLGTLQKPGNIGRNVTKDTATEPHKRPICNILSRQHLFFSNKSSKAYKSMDFTTSFLCLAVISLLEFSLVCLVPSDLNWMTICIWPSLMAE